MDTTIGSTSDDSSTTEVLGSSSGADEPIPVGSGSTWTIKDGSSIGANELLSATLTIGADRDTKVCAYDDAGSNVGTVYVSAGDIEALWSQNTAFPPHGEPILITSAEDAFRTDECPDPIDPLGADLSVAAGGVVMIQDAIAYDPGTTGLDATDYIAGEVHGFFANTLDVPLKFCGEALPEELVVGARSTIELSQLAPRPAASGPVWTVQADSPCGDGESSVATFLEDAFEEADLGTNGLVLLR